MNLNKYQNPILMLLLIVCLGTGCKKDGGGNDGRSSNSISDNSNNSTNDDDNSPEDSGALSLELSWNPPATRVNGDKLYPYEIGGYEIQYREVSEESKEDEENWKSITIYDYDKNLLSTYIIEGISPGRYEVTIKTFDIDGLYSPPSNTVSADKF
jgi:hypothetical protein